MRVPPALGVWAGDLRIVVPLLLLLRQDDLLRVHHRVVQAVDRAALVQPPPHMRGQGLSLTCVLGRNPPEYSCAQGRRIHRRI
eukprot:8958292-Alexandrium_andersonii.AAC.1